MTNDEAVQWCQGKDVKVQFTSQGLVQVQAVLTSPKAARFLQVRGSFAEAIGDIQPKYDGVLDGTISPGDRSLVNARLPGPITPSFQDHPPPEILARFQALFPPPQDP